MTGFQLAPRNDTDALAAQFAGAGRLRIAGILRDGDARRLHGVLTAPAPWNLFILHDGPKVVPLAQWHRMDPAERQSVDAELAVAARDKFEARFLQWPLSETGAAFPGLPPELEALVRFLNGEDFLSVMRAVTGRADIAFADAQATCYRAGDYLHRHSDEVPGKNRIAAYVLNLTPRWQPEWGGLLNFMGADGQVADAWVPGFNALTLLRVPQDHFVGAVAGFVDAPRLAVTGWLRHR